jgi:hypothetical protein
MRQKSAILQKKTNTTRNSQGRGRISDKELKEKSPSRQMSFFHDF